MSRFLWGRERKGENWEALECFLFSCRERQRLRPAEHMGTMRRLGAATPAHAAGAPASLEGRSQLQLQSHMRSRTRGSEERPGALALKLSPGVIELHEDHPGVLLVGLPPGLQGGQHSRGGLPRACPPQPGAHLVQGTPNLAPTPTPHPPCLGDPHPGARAHLVRGTPTPAPASAPTLSGWTTSTARR